MIHIIKNNIAWKALVSSLICISMLSACGSGDDSDDVTSNPKQSVTQEVSITGIAVKGTLVSAIVELFKANDLDTPIAVTSTGTNGEYELTYLGQKGEDSGTLIVKVSVGDNTTMVCDADECNGVANGASLTAAELGSLELITHLVIDATQNEKVNVNNIPINTLTTAATNVLLADISISELSTMTQSSLSTLQKSLTQLVMTGLGMAENSDINLFDINLPDASDIPNGLSVFNIQSSQQGLVTQLSMLNASFAAKTDISSAINTFSQLITDANENEEFSTELAGFLTNLRAEYNDLFSLLNSLDGGLPTDLVLPDFVQLTFPDIDDGVVIDPDGDIIIDPETTTGDWTLTIFGTVTVTSPITITTDIPSITVNDIAAPSSEDTTEIERIFNDQVSSQGVTVSNLSFNMTENTENKIVIEYNATITVTESGVTVTQTQNLIYTWTK